MKDDSYLIIAADAKESHRLQDRLWVPSRNIITVTSLYRNLRGVAGIDVYYTDDALAALVEDAELRHTGRYCPDGEPEMDQGRNWRTWSWVRPKLSAVRPLEAWVHLHESSLEELEERRMGFVTLHSQVMVAPDTPDALLSWVNTINLARAQVAAAVRDTAQDRLIRLASSRIRLDENTLEDGRVLVSASWTARPAAERVAPRWLVGGFDSQSTVKVG